MQPNAKVIAATRVFLARRGVVVKCAERTALAAIAREAPSRRARPGLPAAEAAAVDIADAQGGPCKLFIDEACGTMRKHGGTRVAVARELVTFAMKADADPDDGKTTCPECNGSGKVGTNDCPTCNGSGRVEVDEGDDDQARAPAPRPRAKSRKLAAPPKKTITAVKPKASTRPVLPRGATGFLTAHGMFHCRPGCSDRSPNGLHAHPCFAAAAAALGIDHTAPLTPEQRVCIFGYWKNA